MSMEYNDRGEWVNKPGNALPWYEKPAVANPNAGMPANMYPAMYPNIYYKIQPHVMEMCDQMMMYGAMPSMEMLDDMTDRVHKCACKMHPELEAIAREVESKSIPEPSFRGDFDDFMRRRRRRGIFDDLITILILQELFRRRRY